MKTASLSQAEATLLVPVKKCLYNHSMDFEFKSLKINGKWTINILNK